MFGQVERALKLWTAGQITSESIEKSKSTQKPRTGPIIKTFNVVTGKESTKLTEFNQTNWGKATKDYIRLAKDSLSTDIEFKKIVKLARPFAKRRTAVETTPAEGDQERVLLVSDPDTDDAGVGGDTGGNAGGNAGGNVDDVLDSDNVDSDEEDKED